MNGSWSVQSLSLAKLFECTSAFNVLGSMFNTLSALCLVKVDLLQTSFTEPCTERSA